MDRVRRISVESTHVQGEPDAFGRSGRAGGEVPLAGTGTRLGLLLILAAALGDARAVHSNGPQNIVEWLAWPDFCHASAVWRHDRSIEKFPAKWYRSVDPALVDHYTSKIPPGTWASMHHLCRGLNVMQRIRKTTGKETGRDSRDFLAKEAVAEVEFTYHRADFANPFKAVVAGSLAMAYHYAGEHEQALELIADAIQRHPTVVEPYSAGYIILRQLNSKKDALALLEKCYERTEGTSPENNYFLALEYLETKKYELAREHAKKATELGYPLTGVHRKLRALGQWQD